MSTGIELFLKEKMKQDIVKNLKIVFGDNIVGRMSDLFQPVHECYKLAITKVMGKNLHALVLKNKETALEVINHLKTFHAPPEVILPLDTIKVYPTQDAIRGTSEVIV
jgi:structural maintenance of chromosome 1